MKQTKRVQKRILAERLYAFYLHLYPRTHRRAYGPLMLQTFKDSYRDELATQGKIGMRFWLAVVCDETKSLAREQVAVLRTGWQRVKQWWFAIASGMFLFGGAVVYIIECVK